MVDVLNMNPSVNLMGTADLSVAYSKDFTRLVVSGQEKDLQERVLLSVWRMSNMPFMSMTWW